MTGDRVAGYRLSPQQERLWAWGRRGVHVHWTQAVVALPAPMDVGGLQKALAVVTARHEILRTAFRTLPGLKDAVQVIEPHAAPTVEHVAAADDRRAAVAETLRRVRTGADLAMAPQLRCVAIGSPDGTGDLVLSAPALCTDAAGMRVIVGELMAAYHGRGLPAADEIPQYADYAEWQREITPETTDGALVSDLEPAEACYRLGEDSFARAAAAAGSIEAPLADFLLACWRIALQAIPAQDRGGAAMWLAVDGRDDERLASAVGVYERRVAVPSDAGETDRFDQVALRARQEIDAGEASVGFACRITKDEPSISLLRSRTGALALELAVTVRPRDAELLLSYDPARHDEDGVRRLGERFLRTVEAAAADPSAMVGDLDIRTAAERREFHARNDTRVDVRLTCPHTMVKDQAARRPDTTALVWGKNRLSYRQLAERVAQIAGMLSASGVRRGDRVGICLDRSPDQVAGVLAVWELGAAFVAVGADDPAHRVTRLLEDARCGAVLTDARHRRLLDGCAAVTLLVESAGETRPAPSGRADLDDVAYIAHTSGSTGRPNGVVVSHRSVANYLAYVLGEYGVTASDVVLQQAPFTFDAWLRDCVAPLTAGASVVIVDDDRRRSSAALVSEIRRTGVSRILHSVPTLLRDLAETLLARGERLDQVRTVLSSGEPLYPADRDLLIAAFGPKTGIVNQYGPTECTMTTTFHPVTPGTTGDAVPLGRPIRNARVYVLNGNGRPVTTGAVGEIHIGGAGVAHGYFDQPALTAERFVPDPFAEEPGARMYRTGDLARLRPDGHIEFLGRRDHQVKLRGVRVDLGEIESCLSAHPGVREAAVAAVTGAAGGARLSGHIVPRTPDSPTLDEIRDWLAQRLPAHLVPAVITFTAALPRNRHGKVDRHALAAEAANAPVEAYVAPRSATEQVVARVFAETLGLDRVGADGDFFRLGGHSLLATKVVYEIGEALGVKVPLRSIFEHRTVAALALALRDEGDEHDDGPIPRQPELPDYPVSFPQRRLWLADALGDHGNNVQVVARVKGEVELGLLRRALDLLVARHEALRTTYVVSGGEPVQRIHEAEPCDLSVVDLTRADDVDKRVRRLVLADAKTRFDLTRLPLFTARLMRTAPKESVLLLTLHHIVIDEWSVGVLLRELVLLYDGLVRDDASTLPDMPVRYRDFAAWQRERLSGERIEPLAGYWRRKLAGARLDLALPTDNSPPAEPTLRGGRVSAPLPGKLTARLTRLAEERGATPFMVLLAAFKTLLFQHSGQDDIVVGSPIAGRTRREIEPVVGFFANILVLRTSLAGDPRFEELLDRVKESALGAYGHQDMPFETLVEMLRPDRVAHRIPVARIWFVLHNAPMPAFEAPGIALALEERPSDTAQFDLNMALTQTDGGLVAALEYSSDLFHRATVERLFRAYREVLERVADDPGIRLSELCGHLAAGVGKERLMALERQERSSGKSFSAFRAAKVEPIRVARDALVRMEPLRPGSSQPLVIRPGDGGVALDEWVEGNRDLIAERLRTVGAILFRGFAVESAEDFEKVVRAFSPDLLDYYERSTPRNEVGGKIYTSTEFPPDRFIPLHSESAYSSFWPRTLWFCCLQPPEEGGATPIADTRELLRLLDPGLRRRLAERKVMYIRNYHDGFDIPWQVAFQTDDRDAVLDYCRRAGMEWEWPPDGTLRTRHVLDAVVDHPDTREPLFFNQVHAYHISSLDRQTRRAVLEMFGEDDLPRDVRYGDGRPIDPADLEQIRRAYEQATITFPWQRGDLLLLDNMLMAHGREPYRGARKVVVAMSDPYDRQKLNKGV
ncbi:amino acid adenylation domain-containing protein [Nonomuraea sp. NPDC049400]|uniref:amino acid adenylation domain-containing protein n=1 Tax=Nonomuraea sp. NPDC049400 TaxID=3364352 RepID=UPI00379A6918